MACEANGLPLVTVSTEAIGYLQTLPFPGNIRELKNLVERTILISGSKLLTAADFEAQSPVSTAIATNDSDITTSGHTLDEIEYHTIKKTLEKYNNNHAQVAASLGISRQALYRRMEKYGLKE